MSVPRQPDNAPKAPKPERKVAAASGTEADARLLDDTQRRRTRHTAALARELRSPAAYKAWLRQVRLAWDDLEDTLERTL